MQAQKRQQIAQTLKITRERRKQQVAKVYELKVDKSRLSKATRAYLAQLFLQAKWFYNYVLSQPDVFKVETTVKSVLVKVGGQFEERALTHLSSQIKQGLVTQIHTSIKSLAELKIRGHKVGKLKFKNRLRTIHLKQHGNTYTLTRKKHSPSNGWLHLQRLKTKLHVRGFKQIPANVEFANAYFSTRHGDYFLKVVTFLPKPKSPQVLPKQLDWIWGSSIRSPSRMGSRSTIALACLNGSDGSINVGVGLNPVVIIAKNSTCKSKKHSPI